MLSHPHEHPIAVTYDTDCDGTSIGYFDCEHADISRLPYGAQRANTYIARTEFERAILAYGDQFQRDYWRETGYFSDTSNIRNCEIEQPGFGVPSYESAATYYN